jgi:hypothetical protein
MSRAIVLLATRTRTDRLRRNPFCGAVSAIARSGALSGDWRRDRQRGQSARRRQRGGPHRSAGWYIDDLRRRCAFSLTGTFDFTTRFRATKEDHLASTQSFDSIAVTKFIFFMLVTLAPPVNIAGDYTPTFMADSACEDRLPSDVRTRTYAATITRDLSLSLSLSHPADTQFTAALSGASFDTYDNRVLIFVAGDYLSFDLSDNYVLEKVAPDTYRAIGGVGGAASVPC